MVGRQQREDQQEGDGLSIRTKVNKPDQSKKERKKVTWLAWHLFGTRWKGSRENEQRKVKMTMKKTTTHQNTFDSDSRHLRTIIMTQKEIKKLVIVDLWCLVAEQET